MAVIELKRIEMKDGCKDSRPIQSDSPVEQMKIDMDRVLEHLFVRMMEEGDFEDQHHEKEEDLIDSLSVSENGAERAKMVARHVIDILREGEYIRVRDTSDVGRIVTLKHRGSKWVMRGGYYREKRSERRKNNWAIAATIASVANAVSIVILTCIIAFTPFWLQSKQDATDKLVKAMSDTTTRIEKIESALFDVTTRITELEKDTARVKKK
jgi:hypothetical protein